MCADCPKCGYIGTAFQAVMDGRPATAYRCTNKKCGWEWYPPSLERHSESLKRLKDGIRGV